VAGCRSHIQLRQKNRKTGCRKEKCSGYDETLDYPTKKILFFCSGEVFLLDRGLLMGGIRWKISNFLIL